jgi:hypothetical protein
MKKMYSFAFCISLDRIVVVLHITRNRNHGSVALPVLWVW